MNKIIDLNLKQHKTLEKLFEDKWSISIESFSCDCIILSKDKRRILYNIKLKEVLTNYDAEQ